jgi:hypothetical protein
MRGYPATNMENEGQLELIGYPIKENPNNKDSVKFKNDNLCTIGIHAEDISDVSIVRMPNQQGGSDLRLQTDCKFRRGDGTVKNIKILFDLDDEIITSVGEGIKELLERNKRNQTISPLPGLGSVSQLTNQTEDTTQDPFFIIKQRLARGEITIEEYERLRKIIQP